METSKRRTRRSAGMTLGGTLVMMLVVFVSLMGVTQFSARTVQGAFSGRDASLTVALDEAGVGEGSGRVNDITRPDLLLENARAQAQSRWSAVVERFHAGDK